MAEDVGSRTGSPRDWFGQALVKLAHPETPNFYVFSADLAGGTGVFHFREAYPDRHIEVGISEQALMGAAAGFQNGIDKPVIITGFATFLSRGFEIARLQIFYNNLPVIIAMSHLGVDVGPDGPSNASYEHYALWRSLPGDAPVFHPSCPNEMEDALQFLLAQNGPGVLFTGRSPVEGAEQINQADTEKFDIRWGRSVYVAGNDFAILATGHVVARCITAAKKLRLDGLKGTIYSVPCLKPIDVPMINEIAKAGQPIITVEDHGPVGGLYEAVAGIIVQSGHQVRVKSVCVRGWGQSGEPGELAAHYGIDEEGIMGAVKGGY